MGLRLNRMIRPLSIDTSGTLHPAISLESSFSMGDFHPSLTWRILGGDTRSAWGLLGLLWGLWSRQVDILHHRAWSLSKRCNLYLTCVLFFCEYFYSAKLQRSLKSDSPSKTHWFIPEPYFKTRLSFYGLAEDHLIHTIETPCLGSWVWAFYPLRLGSGSLVWWVYR